MRVGGGFDLTEIASRAGYAAFRVKGKKAAEIFENEAGGHRWQRQPPNDKKGRRHTSTITVAVLPDVKIDKKLLKKKDFEISMTYGDGPGGQKRNKTETCVVLRHKETGVSVRCQATVSQKKNLDTAIATANERLSVLSKKKNKKKRNKKRAEQVGSGQRGDKRRTISVKRDDVVDHVNNKSMSYKQYLKGDIGRLHK